MNGSLSALTCAVRTTLLVAVAAVLAGCVTVHLASSYDDQIDTGLSTIYVETSTFVGKMIAAHGTTDGTYDKNQEFYATEEGKLDALIARASGEQALGGCPSVMIVKKAISLGAPQSAQVQSALAQLPEGDCDVALLKLTRSAYGDMETFHKAQGPAGIPESARSILLDGGVGSLLRAGIAVEAAKKAAQAGQSAGSK